MELTGTLDQVAATTHRAVDRARINSFEALSVSIGPCKATLLFNPDAIIGEVVSDALLPAGNVLVPGQEARLESLGWTRPGGAFHPSFHRTWSMETASETIVHDLITAFLCVAQLEEGGTVTFSRHFWCGAPGGGYPCRCADGEDAFSNAGDRGPTAA